jgi:hypothetical protein
MEAAAERVAAGAPPFSPAVRARVGKRLTTAARLHQDVAPPRNSRATGLSDAPANLYGVRVELRCARGPNQRHDDSRTDDLPAQAQRHRVPEAFGVGPARDRLERGPGPGAELALDDRQALPDRR